MTDKTAMLDRAAMRESFARAAKSYDAAAVVQREIARRLIERLDLIRISPGHILDVGAGTGYCGEILSQRFPAARITAVDIAHPMLLEARNKRTLWQRVKRKHHYINADMEQLPFADASFDFVVSNLCLQWSDDLAQVFRELHRVLAPGGLLLFSTFGPDTLRELRHCWSEVDSQPHINRFLDMHDVGDAMLRASLNDPVMDVEHITLTYSDTINIMRELKQIGAHNVNQQRSRGMTGKQKLDRLVQSYEQFRRDGVLPVTYEAVYGHAWRLNSTAAAVEVCFSPELK